MENQTRFIMRTFVQGYEIWWATGVCLLVVQPTKQINLEKNIKIEQPFCYKSKGGQRRSLRLACSECCSGWCSGWLLGMARDSMSRDGTVHGTTISERAATGRDTGRRFQNTPGRDGTRDDGFGKRRDGTRNRGLRDGTNLRDTQVFFIKMPM